MAYFPLFFDLENRSVLIAGGGQTAAHKLERLSSTGARISIVSPELDDTLRGRSDFIWLDHSWRMQDLEGAFLVIAATDNAALNAQIAAACKQGRILCNVVDNAEESTAVFGSVVSRGPLSIGISTSGASPSAAVWMKKRIDQMIPAGFEDILIWLSGWRPIILRTVSADRRPALFHALFQAAVENGAPLDSQQTQAFIEEAAQSD